MSMLPGLADTDPYSLKLRGSFGRFKTNSSHALQFLNTTLTISQLMELRTASEVFDARNVNFDELMQRDIDSARVASIANNYLASPRKRAIFFPPLLACIAVQEADGQLKPTYTVEQRAFEEGSDRLRTVYDGNAFRVDLFLSTLEQSTREFIDRDNVARPFVEWASEVAINPSRATLMVLDGQHRLQALKMLLSNADTRDIVSEIEQPVCVLWLLPDADSTTKVVTDLRDLFVTVNTEPRRVSGHFILLLRDSLYSALTIRLLADSWKNTSGWSRLHLLEWNTRDEESIHRRLRDFSITTISIIADALTEGVFEVSGALSLLASLKDCQDEFDAIDPEFNPRGLRNERCGDQIDEVIERQIGSHLVPALDVLLRRFRPYAALEERVGAAVSELERDRAAGNSSANNLLIYLGRFIYRPAEMRDELARGAWNAFRAKARPDDRDATYFLNVFQRGYLLTWMRIGRLSAELGVSAIDSAVAYVEAMHQLVGDLQQNYISPDLAYTNGVLYKAGRVNFSADWAKRAWVDVQQATFLRENVQKTFMLKLVQLGYDDIDQVMLAGKLQALGLQAAQRYAQRLHDELVRDVRNNLATYFGGELGAGEMREKRITDSAAFDADIATAARHRFDAAIAPFANKLGVTPSMIESTD